MQSVRHQCEYSKELKTDWLNEGCRKDSFSGRKRRHLSESSHTELSQRDQDMSCLCSQYRLVLYGVQHTSELWILEFPQVLYVIVIVSDWKSSNLLGSRYSSVLENHTENQVRNRPHVLLRCLSLCRTSSSKVQT